MWLRVVAEEGGDTSEAIGERCAASAASIAALGLANSLAYYRGALEAVAGLRITRIVPIGELARPGTGAHRRIALRHDVDADLVAGLACARICADLNLPAAFYILHTSHYYGAFAGAPSGGTLTFARHRGFPAILARMLRTGAEIGLHNDALGVYLDRGADGAAVLRDELAWLRGQGAKIGGTAAHNSAAVYGAECFEVFRKLAVGQRHSYDWRGRWIPLQTLDMASLGLGYEANHPKPRAALDAATEGRGRPMALHAIRASRMTGPHSS